MKRIVSICFLFAAVLSLTALSLVPHHHHRAVMCTVMELCEVDHAYNDSHTTHDTSGENAETEGCVAHASFAPTSVQVGVDTPDAQPLQAVGQTVSCAVPAPRATCSHAGYGLFILAYTSASPNPGSGLRAPPSRS